MRRAIARDPANNSGAVFPATDVALDFDLDRFVRLDMLVTDGEFHVCTCRKS